MAQTTDEYALSAVISFLNTRTTSNEIGIAPGTTIDLVATLTGDLRLSAKMRKEACRTTRSIARSKG